MNQAATPTAREGTSVANSKPIRRDTAWAMSQENVEIVRRLYEEWSAGVERGDPGAAFGMEAVADDFEFTIEGFHPERGREGYVEWFRTWTAEFQDWSLRLERLIDAGHDRVVALTCQSATGRSSGAPVKLNLGTVWELKDGRVVRMRTYRSQAEALEAAGLRDG